MSKVDKASFMMLAILGIAPACTATDDPVGETDSTSAAAAAADTADDDCSELDAQLARARAATERYKNVDVAIADGFVPTDICVSSPVGTMGFHYVNPARLRDPLKLEEPEAVLYLPDDDGDLQLVAIEYLLPIIVDGAPYMGCGANDQSCPPPNPGPPPSLFEGVRFDGPMAGHDETMPWHFDQHVWLYADNPDGMFAQYNPSLSCPAECPHPDHDDHDDHDDEDDDHDHDH